MPSSPAGPASAALHDAPASAGAATPTGPLDGITVIELGQLIAGPFACQILGDFGAEIIKVELPEGGDPMRQWGRLTPEGESLWWSVIGRNKKSVTLDVRTPAGRSALLSLISTADVVVENFRPGTLESWGLAYEDLTAQNPGLIMVRVSGFGQTGPYSHRAGFGAIGEAMGGLRYLVGEPGRPTVRTGLALADAVSGLMGALGAVISLLERRSSGLGQVIDVALYESMLTLMESIIPEYVATGEIRERTGATLPGVAPSNVYPTADGRDIVIAGNHDSVFRRLTELMGRPELADDPRFTSHVARGEHMAEIDEILGSWTKTQLSDELVEALAQAGVPAGPIYRAPDMLADPHFAARDSLVSVDHPTLGSLVMQNVAPKASRTPGTIRWVGPALGAHNDEVLADRLGLTPEQIEQSQGRGAV